MSPSCRSPCRSAEPPGASRRSRLSLRKGRGDLKPDVLSLCTQPGVAHTASLPCWPGVVWWSASGQGCLVAKGKPSLLRCPVRRHKGWGRTSPLNSGRETGRWDPVPASCGQGGLPLPGENFPKAKPRGDVSHRPGGPQSPAGPSSGAVRRGVDAGGPPHASTARPGRTARRRPAPTSVPVPG